MKKLTLLLTDLPKLINQSYTFQFQPIIPLLKIIINFKLNQFIYLNSNFNFIYKIFEIMEQNYLPFTRKTTHKTTLSIWTQSLLLILLFCMLFQTADSQPSMSAAPVSTTINANTTYQITIVNGLLNTTTNSTAVIEITFPSNFFTLNTLQTYTCFNTNTPSQTYPCHASTTNVIQISNPNITSLVGQISISTIKNPGSQEQVTFSYVFKYSNGTIISQATSSLFRSYTPGNLQSCSVSFSPSTVQSTSSVTVTMALGDQVPTNGSIYITFPSSWTYSANSSSTPILTSLTQACTLVSGGSYLTSSLSCSTFGQQVTINQCFSTITPSGTSLSFSISNILSPPTNYNGYTLTVSTYTDTYTLIDQTSCTANQVGPTSISGVSSTTQLTVGSTTGYSMNFNAPVPIAGGDLMMISAVSPYDTYFSFSSTSTVYLSTAQQLSISSSNSSSITLVFPSTMPTFSTNANISIIAGLYIQPLINSGTKSLTLTLLRSGYSYATQTFPLTIQPNSLSTPTITLNTYVVSTVAAYTFSIGLANPLAAKSRIIITLPNQLSIDNGTCTATLAALNSPSSINSSFTCNVTSNRVITLASINTNSLQSSQKLTFTISNILNSQTSKPTDHFTISTYYADTTTDPTDTSTSLTVTMIPMTIGVVTVNSSNPQVAQTSLYTFSYTVKSKFLPNAIIKIGLPSQITFGSTLSAAFSFTYTNSTTTASQSCVLTNQTVNSVQYLQLSSISPVYLSAGTIISLNISSLVNPNSLKPSSSFTFYEVDSSGYVIQRLQTGLTITNTITSTFSSLYASQSSVRMNGQSATYTLNIKSLMDLAINDYIQISMDSATDKNGQMYFTNPMTSCIVTYTLNGVTSTLSTNFQRVSSQLIIITINSPMPSNYTYQIAINAITRARTAQTPNNITVSSFKYVSSSTSYGMSTGTISPSTTNKLNTVQSVSLNILTSPSQLLSYQTFAITVVPTIALQSGDYVIVTIPSLYTFTGTIITVTSSSNLLAIANQSLCIQSNYFCSHYISNPNQIKVQELSTLFSSTTTLTFTIKNSLYLSPSTFSYTTYYFQGSTFASNNLGLDATVTSSTPSTNLTNAVFYLTCSTNLSTYHCMTCASNSTCTSCYQPVNLNGVNYTFDEYKYITSDSKCVTTCGSGYFISSTTGICTKCDSPCSTCQSTSTNCTSCIQNITTNKYYASSNSCLSNCPNGFYADSGNICQSCSSSCSTCSLASTNCTSCPSNTFLSGNTCVTSTGCPFGKFADATSNNCSTCDISCSGCVSSAKNCSSCATGYIVDSSITTYKACTNQCPQGKVNDTANNLGCRCDSQCLTCKTTVSTCLSCNSSSIYKYLYSNTCLTACPQSTYANQSVTGGLACLSCAQSNCRSCNSTVCNQCLATYLLYQGTCVQSCPSATVQTISNGISMCASCIVGCVDCSMGQNLCSTCNSGYVKQSNSSGTYCLAACSDGYVAFNNTICYTSCPDGYENVNQVCTQIKNDSTNKTVVITSQLSSTRRVPFPFTIASVVFLVIIILSKIVLPESMVSTLYTSVVGALEPFSWIVSIIVCALQTSGGSHWSFCSKGVGLLIAALVINLILNVIAMIFFCKYVYKDPKFGQMFNYNQKKVFLGKCPTLTVLVLSIISSHKVAQSLFSNFLLSKHFSYKLETVTHIVPLNYVLFTSVLPSFLAIAGGSLISYELQSYGADSSAFIASIDMILITLIGVIVSLWATNRKSEDYEKQIGPNQPEKHYQTQQILVQGNGDDHSENLNQVFMQKSGIRRQAAKGKNYYYENSRISQRAESHDNEPLTKRQNTLKPINQSNRKKIKANTLNDEHSSQALVINEMQKRRDLKDEFESENSDEKEGDLQIIDLQNGKTKNNLFKDVPLITKIHYPNNNERKQKPDELLKMTNEEKMLLKKKIQSQLTPEEKVKLGILNKQKELKIKKKKQKIEQILKIDEKEAEKLPNQQKNKITQIKEAVDVLKRKQIKIQEYLLYAEIIKQEEGEYDDQSEQQISEINQKDHTIIKGIQDDDQDLEEVIKLSPKRQQGRQNMNKNKSKQKISQLEIDKLGRSKSKDKNSLSKDKKETSKQKTIKKQTTTNKKDKISHKRNKSKLPNDLQVNYNLDEDKKNGASDDDSFDSEKQPELPKARSNIVGKIKNKNRSQKQLNMKKIGSQPGDMMMIDVGQNRLNMTQKDFGAQLQLERADTIPPNYLRATEKVQYKKKEFEIADGDRNPFESENDRETMKSFENDVDFQNQIYPTEFQMKNKKFEYVDESLDMPVKPKIIAENSTNEHDTTMDKKARNITKHDGFDIYQGDELQDQFNYPEPDIDRDRDRQKMDLNHTMSRYSSSNVLNYDSMLRKNMQNEKLKQLEKIYLPRLDSKVGKRKKPRRQLSVSKISTSKL